MRLRWKSSNGQLVGVNNFGFRLRHQAFDKWFREEKTVHYVLEHLRDANFDPEFYRQHEEEIIARFNAENGTQLKLRKKSWQRILQLVS